MPKAKLIVTVCAAFVFSGCNKNKKETNTPAEQATPENSDAQQATPDAGEASGSEDTGFAPNDDPNSLPPLRCSGNEPNWSFELTPGGKLYWEPMSGEKATIDVSTSPAGENAWSVSFANEGPLKAVKINKEACSDTMSDDPFSHSVSFTNAEGQELKGCCNPL